MSSPHDPQSSDLSVESQGNPPIMHEIRDTEVGTYTGQCKWFSDKLGYGFVTVIKDSELKGKDIFVHHSGIKPLNSHYKTLKKGEYVNFNVIEGDNGIQAVDITGIAGGSLMCDIMPMRRTATPPPGSPPGSVPGVYASMLPPPPVPMPVSMHSAPGGRNGGGRGRGAGRGNGGGGYYGHH